MLFQASNTTINVSGNRAAIGALIFGGVFSIILSIIIVRSLIKLRSGVFPVQNTFCWNIFKSNKLESILVNKVQDHKLHFYATFVAFILLLCMFLAITIIFFKSAFDINSLQSTWALQHLRFHKAWAALSITIAILCFLASVFFVCRLVTDFDRLKSSKCVHIIHRFGQNIITHEVIIEKASIFEYLWYTLEIISALFCIFLIIVCIYFTWGILN